MSIEKVIIGKIIAPHGVRGDIRIQPLTDFPERFADLKKISLEDGTVLEITDVRNHKGQILAKFKNYNDRNLVEQLRGKLITVPRNQAVVLPKGHFYIFDLIGLEVFEESGNFLGNLTDVLQTGSNDVYVVEKSDSTKPILIPALKKVVLDINIETKKMLVKLQEELE